MAYYVDKEFKATITDIKNITTYDNKEYTIIEVASNEDSSKYKIAIARALIPNTLDIGDTIDAEIDVNSKDNGGSNIEIYHAKIEWLCTNDFVKQNENGEWVSYCDFSVNPYIFTLIEENKYNEAH